MLVRLLIRFLRPYARQLAAVGVLQLAATTATLLLPTLNARIIDRGVATGDADYILRAGGLMLAISAGQIACSALAVGLGSYAATAYGRDLRAAIFHHVGTLASREVHQLGAASLLTRTTNDVQQVQALVMMVCTTLVAAPITCAGAIGLALREDATLARVLLVSVPVLIGVLAAITRGMLPQFRAMQPRLDTVARVLREQIGGARVIRAFVREDAEAARFATANRELTHTALRVGRLQAVLFPSVQLVSNVALLAVLWFGARRVAAGALELGSVLAFLSYLMQLIVAIMLVSFVTAAVPRAAVCAARIAEVLATRPSVASPARPVTPTGAPGALELREVEFRYPHAELPVVSRISFAARAGQLTAIVGGTGAGKTTLLEVIARLSDPTAGSVLVEGSDARELALAVLWAKIGLVPQRPYLFAGTVASTLRDGAPGASDAELWAALDIAQARELVEAMPGQLAAPIAQGGGNLSGGQRQRLAIARALARRPAIYLFDDAFSALDAATEARLRAALRDRLAGATVIMVAQRVASVVDADQILVLDAGAIVGAGRHAQLVRDCPAYAELVASQRQAGAE